MDTLGSYLREARESLGLDLREASQQTRIALNFLKAIEDEDFAKLPGEVFVKGFLKNYARFLHLPEEEVMKRYASHVSPAQAAPASNRLPLVKAAKTKVGETRPASVPDHPAPLPEGGARLEQYLWAGGIVILVAALLIVVIPARHRGPDPGAPVRSTVTVTDRTTTAETVTGPTSTMVPEKLYLDIIALDDLWVLVRTDASPQKKAVLKKGESVTWSADERFVLSYGGAGSAKILLNGRELAVAAAKDAVVRDLTITAKGIAAQKVEPDRVKPRKPATERPPDAKPQPAAPQPGPSQPRPGEHQAPMPAPAPATTPATTAAQPSPESGFVIPPLGQ